LNWDEQSQPKHKAILALYRDCLKLRREELAFRPASRDQWHVEALEMGIGCLWMRGMGPDWLLLFDLVGGHQGSLSREDLLQPLIGRQWRLVLSTEDPRYGGNGALKFDPVTRAVRFDSPGLMVLRASATQG
jgi:maltooligosyltrehalose trehalohydrolase